MLTLSRLQEQLSGARLALCGEGQTMIDQGRRRCTSPLDDREIDGAQINGHEPAAQQQQSRSGDAGRKP